MLQLVKTFSCLYVFSSPLLIPHTSSQIVKSSALKMSTSKDLYRADGIRINYDPYSPEMLEKYGSPGQNE